MGELEGASLRTIKMLGYAYEYAQQLGHNSVATEHILLGLMHEPEKSSAAIVLWNLGVDLSKLRSALRRVDGMWRMGNAQYKLPWTQRAEEVKKLAFDASREMAAKRVEPYHLLIGLLRCGEGVAHDFLIRSGVTADSVCAEVERLRFEATRFPNER